MDSKPVDIVVGCISGLSFEQIAPWVMSLDECGFCGRRVVIRIRADFPTLAELNRRGYETYDASSLHVAGNRILNKHPRNDEISVNRFYYIWHFLRHADSNPRYLVATDVRDVVFQQNPILWLERNLGQKRLVVGCESLRFEHEPWGAETMQACYGPQVYKAFQHNLIYNAGTIAGEFRTLIDLCLQVFLLSPGARVVYSDQQALNLLLTSGVHWKSLALHPPRTDGHAKPEQSPIPIC